MLANDRWQEEAERQLGRTIVATRLLGGGDFAESFWCELDDGNEVFAKTHKNPPPDFFTTEAAGLDWLRVGDHACVPQVLAVSDTPPLLVLEWIEPGSATSETEPAFGRALAWLHQEPFERFGRPDKKTTGSQAMDNTPSDSWNEFYADRRLLPLAEKAAKLGAVPAGLAAAVANLASNIDRYTGPAVAPSCLHGDLWAGNRMVDHAGTSWLIDPASFGGDREFDLALMSLFGGFSSQVFDAYDEVFPLADGWRERVPLHQLATLLVHAIKFGGSYVGAVEAATNRYR